MVSIPSVGAAGVTVTLAGATGAANTVSDDGSASAVPHQRHADTGQNKAAKQDKPHHSKHALTALSIDAAVTWAKAVS